LEGTKEHTFQRGNMEGVLLQKSPEWGEKKAQGIGGEGESAAARAISTERRKGRILCPEKKVSALSISRGRPLHSKGGRIRG